MNFFFSHSSSAIPNLYHPKQQLLHGIRMDMLILSAYGLLSFLLLRYFRSCIRSSSFLFPIHSRSVVTLFLPSLLSIYFCCFILDLRTLLPPEFSSSTCMFFFPSMHAGHMLGSFRIPIGQTITIRTFYFVSPLSRHYVHA